MAKQSHIRNVVIDTDPGLDDAVALWLAIASPELLLRAVLATAGNVGLDRTAANAAAIVSLSGRALPVHRGADRPLSGRAIEAAHVHGADGLGAVSLPPGAPPAPGLAADILRGLLRDGPPTTLIGIGPVTNLALALATEPALAASVPEIVLMSGADGDGNVTPHAEFNAHADPEALAIVLASGPPVTFATLDLTGQALVTDADIASLAKAGAGRCLAASVALLASLPDQPRYRGAGKPIHDACAVAWLLAPKLFTHRPVHARAILDGPERGRTIFAEPDAAHPANARLLETIDRAGFLALLRERLSRLP
jgi:purine nucleosidase